MSLPAPIVETFPVVDRPSWLALRRHDVTASAAAALFGVHPYVTAYGLWAEKSGKIAVDQAETGPMRRGRLLEPVAVELLREERPNWRIERGTHYHREPALRIGATPDVIAYDEAGRRGVVQLKSVDPSVFRKSWRQEGIVEPPLWIAVQALVEARLAGAEWAAVAALVVGHEVSLEPVDIPLVPEVMERLAGCVADFWRLVESGTPPDVDYGRDGDLIEALYVETGEIVDLRSDNRVSQLVSEKEMLAAQATHAAKRLHEIKAEMLLKLGTASHGMLADGRSLVAQLVKRRGYTVEDSEHVALRIRAAKQRRAA